MGFFSFLNSDACFKVPTGAQFILLSADQEIGSYCFGEEVRSVISKCRFADWSVLIF